MTKIWQIHVIPIFKQFSVYSCFYVLLYAFNTHKIAILKIFLSSTALKWETRYKFRKSILSLNIKFSPPLQFERDPTNWKSFHFNHILNCVYISDIIYSCAYNFQWAPVKFWCATYSCLFNFCNFLMWNANANRIL